ncbi:MAG TPA: ABC transporter substrate-binding protein [Spirochaetia bacterium]|nr:ABC transporter substrate-binding protein [Spirochaetia bacterium]
MRFKKFLVILAGISLVLVAQNVFANGAAEKSKITVGFVPSLASDPFFLSMQYGAQQEANKLGVKLIWQGASGTYSPSAQLPYVHTVLADKLNSFVLVPTDANALMPAVKQAIGDKIPVITADTTVSDTSVLTSRITGDNVGGGKLAANLLVKAIGGSGQVFVMNGLPGVTTDQLRMQGFRDALAGNSGVNDVGFQYSQDQPTHAATVLKDELLRYPNLKGIFCIDDESAIGVIQGLQNLGKLGQIKVVAYDAEPAEVSALEQGKLVALVAQQPAKEGQMAVQYAVDAAKGQTSDIQKSVIIPDVLITAANYKSETQYFYRTKS